MNSSRPQAYFSSQVQVIFDTDPGIDDAMALFLLARHPSLRLRAVTSVFGNGSLAVTTANAQALCGFFGQQVPVAAGAAGPLHSHAEREFSCMCMATTVWAAWLLWRRPPCPLAHRRLRRSTPGPPIN
ncbi:nucleoside hydrolase [Roseateles sp. GG27B]